MAFITDKEELKPGLIVNAGVIGSQHAGGTGSH
jgi:hypothetical protein